MTSSRVVRLLAWLTFVPIATVATVELNKTIVVWHIRIVDLVDLVVLAPFYFGVLFRLHRALRLSGSYSFASIGCITFFLYGHAMHVTANAINTYMTEVNDYRDSIPDDAYDLIYFFDETLSHYLLFTGLFSLFVVWCVSEQPLEALEDRTLLSAGFLGGLQGIAQGLAMIEATKPYLPFVIAGLLVLVILRLEHGIFTRSPLRRFTLWAAFGLIVTPPSYLLLVGSLAPPSTL